MNLRRVWRMCPGRWFLPVNVPQWIWRFCEMSSWVSWILQVLLRYMGRWRKCHRYSVNIAVIRRVCRYELFSISVKIVEKFRFCSIFMEISILVKIDENLDFAQNCRKCSQNFRKMSIWVKICKYFDFGQTCRKISSLVNIYGNLDFGQSLWISRFWSKLSWNLDLGQHFRKILILVNIFGRIDLGRNFPKILVLVQISEKCRFGSKFANMSIWVKSVQKSRFW